jgi:hypothetical protein
MRKLFFLFSLCIVSIVQAQELSYYLPQDISYNKSIPTPESIIGHHVGEWHVTHDRLVNFMKAIASAAPDRVKLELMGRTFETREQLLLIFTAKKNLDRLEEIRLQHLQLSDATKPNNSNLNDMPVVVWIGHSIHGNESSGSNAALLSAYYLAAAQGSKIDSILNNTIILFDPSFNPDGLQRFSTWVNQHKSKNLVTDPNSREFNEVWPGGRFNHYWFDLNRDWLPAVHVESQNRLQKFQDWKPNILTDHHEQGSNATYFFQPGVPSRVNPLTPAKNQELTGKIAAFHAKALDKIGSLYFTKENYDDFYYGKGSTYPDAQGCIGILFEQASSRGHAQQTSNGLLKFSYTIRNQFTTTLSTLDAAQAMRVELLNYQKDFFKNNLQNAETNPTKGWVFGDAHDATKTNVFLQMLLRQKVDVFVLNNDLKADNQNFEKGKAFFVPAKQMQQTLLHGIFDKTLNYKDSIFYDITAWTMPLAFGLPYAELGATSLSGITQGKLVQRIEPTVGSMIGDKTNYAYAFEWADMNAPRMLYALMEAGVNARVSTTQFASMTSQGKRDFKNGTILIPIAAQKLDADKVYQLLKDAAAKNGINIYGLSTGLNMQGVDLGSSKFVPLSKPNVAMLVGTGVSATDAGEVWHLLDQRMDMPLNHIEIAQFNRVEMSKYSTLVMVSGTYTDLNKEKLKAWVQAGGTLICLEEAAKYCAENGISNATFKKPMAIDSSISIPYNQREEREGAQLNFGGIYRASLDNTHPLGYGYSVPFVDMFKAGKNFMEKSKNPYCTPLQYGSTPLQSGYISKQNYDLIKNSAAVVVSQTGAGKVISIADNPNFRAFWLGGNKLMMNAIFFGRMIEVNTGRNGD